MSEVQFGLYPVVFIGSDRRDTPVLGPVPIASQVITSSGTSQQSTIVADAATLGAYQPFQVMWRVSVVGAEAVVANFATNPAPANAAAAKVAGPVLSPGGAGELFAVTLGHKVAVINA